MINVKCYNNLPQEAKDIRIAVFNKEQGFIQEFDNTDNYAYHFVLYKDGVPVGVGRLFTEDNGETYHIGRVAVLKEYRKYHLGSAIMEEMIKKAKELHGKKIVLSAQCRVEQFYEKLGFKKQGDIYYDEFCPHIQMEYII